MVFTKAAYAFAKQISREFDASKLKNELTTHIVACYEACGSPQGIDLVRWVVKFVELAIVKGDESLKTTVMAYSILTLLRESTRFSKTVFPRNAELDAVIPEGFKKDKILDIISKTQSEFQASAAEAASACYSDRPSMEIVLRDLSEAKLNPDRLASFILSYYLLLKKTKCFGQTWQKTCVKEKKEGYDGKLEIPILENVVAAFAPVVSAPAFAPVVSAPAFAPPPVVSKRTIVVDDSSDEEKPKKKPRDDTVYEVTFDPSLFSHSADE